MEKWTSISDTPDCDILWEKNPYPTRMDITKAISPLELDTFIDGGDIDGILQDMLRMVGWNE